MRVLHTSDWHLGQTLHEASREYEHGRFLAWLLDTLQTERADALLVSGDVFESANPPPAAQRAYYDFLAECRRRLPQLDIVVIAGNHDSPGRIDAPRSLLRFLHIAAVGVLPRREDGAIDAERVLVPLHRSDGSIGAWVLAVPFLRRGDLPPLPVNEEEGEGAEPDPGRRLCAGVRAVYAEVHAAARGKRRPGQALIALGHMFLDGGRVSEQSERPIQVGHLGPQALPLDVFPADLAYVGIGHLHLPQAIGGFRHLRYAGSPIPLSLTEKDYPHQVLLLEFDGAELRELRELHVPRFVPIRTVPDLHLPLDSVLTHLHGLPREPPPGAREEERPYLEVRVLRDPDGPDLRAEIEKALEGAWARLLRINVLAADAAEEGALGDQLPRRDLRELDPTEVFRRLYERERGDEAPAELLATFQELLDAARQAEEAPAP